MSSNTVRRRRLRRALRCVLDPLKRSSAVRSAARSGEYARLRDAFVENGRESAYGADVRRDLVRRFERVDESVAIASTPAEALMLAEMLLSLEAEGDIVECGCFAGGSTVKLSILAELLGRRLVVFDSFEGLPDSTDDDRHDLHARHSREWVTEWTAGRYSSGLEAVRSVVAQLGSVGTCDFVPGWFKDTLSGPDVPSRVAFVFSDVDMPSSARDCLTFLWPRISCRGIFASHDVAYIKVMQALADPDLWRNVLQDGPPIFFGAGFGLGDLAPHLGFAVKGRDLPAAYIKGLFLVK